MFQVHSDNFTFEPHPTHGRVLKSKEPIRNWKCEKISDSKYEATEQIQMHAVFLAPEEDCHYSPEESRKTRVSGASVKLADLISQDKSRQRSRSRGRSRTKKSSSRSPEMDFRMLKGFDNMTL